MVSGEPSISSSLLWLGAPPIEKPEGPALSKGRENFGSEFGVTPNASCASTSGARPLIGMFSSCRWLITWPVLELARVQHRSFGRYRYRLIDRAHLKRDIELLALVGGDADLRIDIAFEPRRLRRDRIWSGRQKSQHISAVAIGHRLKFCAGFAFDGMDFRTRHGGLLLIENSSAQAAAELLGKNRRRRQATELPPPKQCDVAFVSPRYR